MKTFRTFRHHSRHFAVSMKNLFDEIILFDAKSEIIIESFFSFDASVRKMLRDSIEKMSFDLEVDVI